MCRQFESALSHKMKKVVIEIKPIIVKDLSNNCYTIFDKSNSGAIISDSVKSMAIEKFKEASIIACFAKTLIEHQNNLSKNIYVPKFIGLD